MQHRDFSRCNSLVVSQNATERFVADDLFVLGKRHIFIEPVSSEWPVVLRLMRTRFVVKLGVTRNKMIEVLLAEDDEESQAFILERFPPSFDECILVWGSWSRGLHAAASQEYRYARVHPEFLKPPPRFEFRW